MHLCSRSNDNHNPETEQPMEIWPKTFKTPADAVHWADSFLVAGRAEQMRLAPRGKDSDDPPHVFASLDEAQSLAMTISIELRRVRNPASGVYRYVHGRSRVILDAADHLAHMAWTGPGAQRRKTIAICRDLACLVLEDKRRSEHAGRGLSMEQIARQVGMSRKWLYETWFTELSSMRSEMERLLIQAGAELEQTLDDLGILSR